MLLALVLAVLPTLAVLGACSSAQERRSAAREAAVAALQKGDRNAALKQIRKLRAEADTAESLQEVAAMLVQAGEAPQAAWILEDAVARYPERLELRLALGNVAMLTANASMARQAVSAIPPSSEYHAQALLLLAQAEIDLGNLDRGLEILTQAQELYPDRPEARMARIATLVREDRYDEARKAVEEARAALDPEEHADLLARMDVTFAEILAAQGDVEGAIASVRARLDEDPGRAPLWQVWVRLMLRAQHGEEALAEIDQQQAARPDDASLYALRASILAALGRSDEAAVAFRAGIERSPSAGAYLALAEFHANRAEVDEAFATLEEGLARFPGEPMLLMSQTEALIGMERLDEADDALDAFSDAAPDAPQADYLRARIELARGHPERAARRLRELMPSLDRAGTQYWLGEALEAQGDFEGARRRYGIAITRQPSWPPPYYGSIRLAQRRGDWREVAGHSQRLLRSSPGQVDACLALAEALINLDEGVAAYAVARTCGEMAPERYEPLVLQAQALTAQARHDEAIAALDAAAESHPDTPRIEAERVLALGIAGRIPEGLAQVEADLAAHPESARLHAAHAALLFGAGEAEAGSAAVDRALSLDPDDPTPLRMRAEFRVASGHFRAAEADCERYLAVRPDDPKVNFALGLAYQFDGRPDDAIAAYRRAAALDEQSADARNNLAMVYAAEGRMDEALAAASEAYALDKENASIIDTLGWLYLRKGVLERSIALLEQAHRLDADLPDAQLHLAQAYAAADRDAEARALLTDLQRRVAPDDPLRPELDATLDGLS